MSKKYNMLPPGDAQPIQSVVKKSSDIQAFGNIIKSFVGVGVLALPYAVKEAGLYAALISMFFIALASNYTIRQIVICKHEIVRRRTSNVQRHNEKTPLIADGNTGEGEDISYGDIGYYNFGKKGRYLVNFAIISSQLGFCCAYVIFIADNMHTIVTNISLEEWVLIILPIIILLSWIRNMKYLAPVSIAANFALVMGVTVVMYFAFKQLKWKSSYPALNPKTYPLFFGTAVFGFEGINLALPIESSMEKPHHYFRLLDGAMVFVAVLYLFVGGFGYIAYGDATLGPITLNLPEGEVIVTVVKVALCAQLLSSFAVQLYPVSTIIEDAAIKPTTAWPEVKRTAMRTVLVMLIALVAVLVPFFQLFTALVGAFSNSVAAFIFPPIFTLYLFGSKKMSYFALIVSVLILVIGVIASGVCSTIAVMNIIAAFKN